MKAELRALFVAIVAGALATTSIAAPTAVTLTLGQPLSPRPVVWGADAKLSAKPWAESPHAADITRRVFVEGGFDVFRVPIYAMRSADDPIYAGIAGLARDAKRLNPALKIFASVANGDGDRRNWLHGKEKFPESMLGGRGVYTLRHEVYAAAIDDYLRMMQAKDAPIDWLGIFNEDPARPDDYLSIYRELKAAEGVTRVGVETWALRAGVRTTPALAPLSDIIGSHFYDDTESRAPIPRSEWKKSWRALVKAADGKPVWFTEATDFRGFENDSITDLLDGLDRLFPALNAGIDGVVIYQVVPRLVNYRNDIATTKWTGFQALIQSTRRGVRLTTSHNGPVEFDALACTLPERGSLDLHLLNSTAQELTVTLAGPRVAASASARTWSAQSDGDIQALSLGPDQTLTLPPRTYLVLRVTPSTSS
jgi:hypothetical protein